MERLKAMKNTLMACVEGQLGNLQEVDTHELGEAIDMIKDLEEALYYCSITKAMEDSKKEEEIMDMISQREYYTPMTSQRYMSMPYERDMDRDMGRMYYPHMPRYYTPSSGNTGGNNSGTSNGMSGNTRGYSTSYYTEREMMPLEMRDEREGRSPMSRKMYMESKEMKKDNKTKVQELEKYMQELGEDIVDMIKGTSPEEKAILEKRLTQLASKVAQLNV